jgi:hypothetical protein
MQLRFVPSETTFSYFEALEGYLGAHGRPLAFYSDKHSVFRVSQKDLNSPLTKSGLADSLWPRRCGDEHGAGSAG